MGPQSDVIFEKKRDFSSFSPPKSGCRTLITELKKCDLSFCFCLYHCNLAPPLITTNRAVEKLQIIKIETFYFSKKKRDKRVFHPNDGS